MRYTSLRNSIRDVCLVSRKEVRREIFSFGSSSFGSSHSLTIDGRFELYTQTLISDNYFREFTHAERRSLSSIGTFDRKRNSRWEDFFVFVVKYSGGPITKMLAALQRCKQQQRYLLKILPAHMSSYFSDISW